MCSLSASQNVQGRLPAKHKTSLLLLIFRLKFPRSVLTTLCMYKQVYLLLHINASIPSSSCQASLAARNSLAAKLAATT